MSQSESFAPAAPREKVIMFSISGGIKSHNVEIAGEHSVLKSIVE